VFSAATAGVLSAGTLQHHFGWQTVNYGVMPLIAVMGVALLLLAGSRRRAAAATP
jgi:hypothetical protein